MDCHTLLSVIPRELHSVIIELAPAQSLLALRNYGMMTEEVFQRQVIGLYRHPRRNEKTSLPADVENVDCYLLYLLSEYRANSSSGEMFRMAERVTQLYETFRGRLNQTLDALYNMHSIAQLDVLSIDLAYLFQHLSPVAAPVLIPLAKRLTSTSSVRSECCIELISAAFTACPLDTTLAEGHHPQCFSRMMIAAISTHNLKMVELLISERAKTINSMTFWQTCEVASSRAMCVDNLTLFLQALRLITKHVDFTSVHDSEICSKLIDPSRDVSLVLDLKMTDQRRFALLKCMLYNQERRSPERSLKILRLMAQLAESAGCTRAHAVELKRTVEGLDTGRLSLTRPF